MFKCFFNQLFNFNNIFFTFNLIDTWFSNYGTHTSSGTWTPSSGMREFF